MKKKSDSLSNFKEKMKKISFLLFVIIAISKSINSFPSADISPEANTSSPGDSLIDSLNSDYNAKQIESVLNSSDKTAGLFFF